MPNDNATEPPGRTNRRFRAHRAILALMLAVASVACSDAESSSSTTTVTTEPRTNQRPGEIAPPATSAPPGPTADQAAEALDRVRAQIPYPADIQHCVEVRAAADADALAALEAADIEQPDSLAPVLEAAAACVVAIQGAPRFAEDLQRQAGGELSAEQLDCATDGYAALDPATVEAATAALLNPSGDGAEDARAPLEDIIDGCGIDR